ncbi:hypothetical protein GQ53DRAFT_876482 [Thozetella sp. PMI_491]|nr:hypothetical protein GQ53DRAFT_876482 [Thozetella sp. PMI_491]
MSGLRFEPAFKAWRDALPGTPSPPPTNLAEIRAMFNTFTAMAFSTIIVSPDIQKTAHGVPSGQNPQLTVTHFFTAQHRTATEAQPALFWIHGGGMVAGTVDIFSPYISSYVTSSGVQVFAVDYRKAPEDPAPAALEDCYAALLWVLGHAADFHLDPARVGIYGDSAGGGLAAGTVLAARDRGLNPPLAKQILVYPMLDDRTITRVTADMSRKDFLVWTVDNNTTGWRAYLGEDKAGKEDVDVSIYAAPSRATDLTRLPSTYVDVGTLDLFRDESIDYVARLTKADVEVELHLYPGLPHGFEFSGIESAQRALENRVKAMQSF